MYLFHEIFIHLKTKTLNPRTLNSNYVFFFSTNLIFLFTCVFCALIKSSYVYKEERNDVRKYHPAHKEYIIILCGTLLEFPYLLNIESDDALLYARVFALVQYPLWSLALMEKYFFKDRTYSFKSFLIAFILYVIMLPLTIKAFEGGNSISGHTSHIIILAAATVSFAELIFCAITLRVHNKKIREVNQQEYTSSDGFHKKYSTMSYVVDIGLLITILLSISDSRWAKMSKDLLFIVIDLWITSSSFHSHKQTVRLVISSDSGKPIIPVIAEKRTEVAIKAPGDVQSAYLEQNPTNHNNELMNRITDAVIDEKLYKDPSLKLETIAKIVGTNKKYVSNAIGDSIFASFYMMINTFRVIKALEIKKNNPWMKQDEVAEISGFSSRFTLLRWNKVYIEGKLPKVSESLKKRICKK